MVFDVCKVKAISRNNQHLSIYANILQKPVTNFKVSKDISILIKFEWAKNVNLFSLKRLVYNLWNDLMAGNHLCTILQYVVTSRKN